MVRVSRRRQNIRWIDAFILLLLAVLLIWPGWREFANLKPLAAFSALTVYFFDSDDRKTVSGLLVFLTAAFFLSFRQNEMSVLYSLFGAVQAGFTFWLSTRLITRGPDRRFWTFSGGLIFLTSAVLAMEILPKQEEMYLFLILQAGISLLPVLVEREELSDRREIWRLSGFQQFVGRVFFLFWGISYRYEIKALSFFEETYMFFIAAMVFLPVFALVNWRTVKWDYLHESFISLLVMYGLISAQPSSQTAIAVLVLAGASVTVNRLRQSPPQGLQKAVRTMEAGGFGGFYFFISLAVAYIAHLSGRGIGFACVAGVIFIFAWAGAAADKGDEAEALPRRGVVCRLLFQLASPFWLAWIFWGR